MKNVEDNAAKLQAHMLGTYHNLRVGIGVIGLALPVLLWLGGQFLDRMPLRGSMSAYYYSPTMRNVFVGILFALGVGLYLYKGFSTKENWALNAAGLLALGVAMVPTTAPDKTQAGLSLHAAFAVVFFACIAYVSVFRSSDTLSLIRDTGQAEWFRTLYRALGIGMIVSPVIAVILTRVLQRPTEESSLLFFLEAVAVVMFGLYWLVKSWELRRTSGTRLALEGKLQASPDTPAAQDRGPGRLVQLSPDSPADEVLVARGLQPPPRITADTEGRRSPR
jgi:hypothetical protein